MGFAADQVNTALNAIGYATDEIEDAFKKLGGDFIDVFKKARETLNPSNW